jgi:hypothetical protein
VLIKLVGQGSSTLVTVIFDMRGLNKISETDAYPMPLQDDIIAAMAGCQFISVLDAVSFFYQRKVDPRDTHKLTVVSHRGQEEFQMAVMGYENSPGYAQRQIDSLLRPIRHFARVYVDDVGIFSRTKEDQETHLRSFLRICQKARLKLSQKKSFIAFPSVQQIGQGKEHSRDTKALSLALLAATEAHASDVASTEGYLGGQYLQRRHIALELDSIVIQRWSI